MSKVTEYRDPIPQVALLAGGLAVATRGAEAATAYRHDADQVLLDLWDCYKKLWQELDRLGREEDTAEGQEQIAVCGEKADRIEREILSRPASGVSGIAVKLRLILNVAPPPEYWDAEHEMIASALADAERLAVASLSPAQKNSA